MVDDSRGDGRGRFLSFMYFFLYIFFVTSRRNASYPSRFYSYIFQPLACAEFSYVSTEGSGNTYTGPSNQSPRI